MKNQIFLSILRKYIYFMLFYFSFFSNLCTQNQENHLIKQLSQKFSQALKQMEKRTEKRIRSFRNNNLPFNQLEKHLDLYIPGMWPAIRFERRYILHSKFKGSLGDGWTHSYDIRLKKKTGGYVTIDFPDKRQFMFKEKENNIFIPLNISFSSLTVDPKGFFQLTEKYGGITTFNPEGLPVIIADRNGNSLELNYNDQKCLSTLKDSSGQITRLDYDELNRLNSINGPKGKNVSYKYNDKGFLESVKDFENQPTNYSYDANLDLNSITNSKGKCITFIKDRNNCLVKIKNEINQTITTIHSTLPYDKGFKVEITYQNGAKEYFWLDINGLITAKMDCLGNKTTYKYDQNKNIIKIEGPQKNCTHFAYDTKGNLSTITNASNQKIFFTHHPQLNLITSFTDSKNNNTTFSYDQKGNIIKIIYPDHSFEKFTYDTHGNILSKTDRSLRTILFEHDVKGNLTKKEYPGKVIHNFSYNDYANIETASNENGTIKFQYNDSGRVILAQNLTGECIKYKYNSLGQLEQMVYPDHTIIGYNYDENSFLKGIDINNKPLVKYSYNPMGKIKSKKYQNGTETSFLYNLSQKIKKIEHKKTKSKVFSFFLYDYDPNGNRIKISTQEKTRQYKYDSINQLIQVQSPGNPEINFHYDKARNRIRREENNKKTIYSTNSLSQYTNINGDTLIYDKNGNLKSKKDSSGTSQYFFDIENRLIKVITPDETVHFSYDPLGRRISKTTSAGTIYYIYSGQQVIMEKNEDGNILAMYIYGQGLDKPVMMIRNNKKYFYLYDGTGNIVHLTNRKKQIEETYTYSPYGKPQTQYKIENPYLFTGRRYDREIGLYYNRTRYYDPEMGRFLSPDPIGITGGENLYAYVNNNPINNIDPLGLVPAEIDVKSQYYIYYKVISQKIGNWISGTASGIMNNQEMVKMGVEVTIIITVCSGAYPLIYLSSADVIKEILSTDFVTSRWEKSVNSIIGAYEFSFNEIENALLENIFGYNVGVTVGEMEKESGLEKKENPSDKEDKKDNIKRLEDSDNKPKPTSLPPPTTPPTSSFNQQPEVTLESVQPSAPFPTALPKPTPSIDPTLEVKKEKQQELLDAFDDSCLENLRRLNPNGLPPPPPPGAETLPMDIQQAIEEGEIEIQVDGTNSRSSILLTITNKNEDKWLELGIEPGTTFEAKSLNVQNMAIRKH